MQQATIGNYRILSELAMGSFGRVYLAQHTVLTNRTVALKLMQNTPLNTQEERDKFLQEARTLDVLKHPFILPVIDVGIHGGLPYIVSEYAAQGSLRRRLQQYSGQPLPTEMALTILGQVGYGLQYAHQHSIVHRDLKPENILFNTRGEALLADFGLATPLASASLKLTSSAGTPNYMAPEQFQGAVSRESDQYALGCIAYELLTGQRVFNAPDPAALMFEHFTTMPKPLSHYNPTLSPSIEHAVLKALSKQRQNRHADVQTFLAALGILQEPIPQPTGPTKRIDRHPAPAPVTPILPLLIPTAASSPSLPPFSAPVQPPPTPNDLTRATPPFSFPQVYNPTSRSQSGTAGPQPGLTGPTGPQPGLTGPTGPQPGLTGPQNVLYPPNASNTFRIQSTPTSNPPRPGSFQPTSPLPGGTGPRTARRWPVIILTVCLLLLVAGGVSAWFAFPQLHAGPHITVTITPVKTDLHTPYTLTGVPGTPDPAKHQIAASFLTYTTPSHSQTASATGTSSSAASSASGSVTFISNYAYDQVVPSGTSLTTCSNSPSSYGPGSPCYSNYEQVSITTTEYAYIPAATSGPSYATVGAVAQQGSVGNIAAGMVDSSGSFWFTTNYYAFTGGQDGQSSAVVTQSDITNAENALAASQTQAAETAILKQVPANQKAIGKPACKSSTSADHAAGDQVSTLTVKASVTCTLDAYDQAGALALAAHLFVTDNAHYSFASTPTTQLGQVTTQKQTVTIPVQVQGTGVYQFTDALKQQFVHLIEDKVRDQAKTILMGQQGVAAVTISGTSSPLPNDPTQISIVIAKE